MQAVTHILSEGLIKGNADIEDAAQVELRAFFTRRDMMARVAPLYTDGKTFSNFFAPPQVPTSCLST